MKIEIKDFKQISNNYDGRLVEDSKTGQIHKSSTSWCGRVVLWFRKHISPGSIAEENRRIMSSFIKALKDDPSFKECELPTDKLEQRLQGGKPLTGMLVRQEISRREAILRHRSETAWYFARQFIRFQDELSKFNGNVDDLIDLRGEVQVCLDNLKTRDELTEKERSVLKDHAVKLMSQISKRLHVRAAIETFEQSFPGLDSLHLEEKFNEEALNALGKLHEKKFLNDLFLKRLSNYVLTGFPEGLRKSQSVSFMPADKVLATLNNLLPEIASGANEYIDTIFGDPYLDDFALRMKLSLNEKDTHEMVVLKHRCSVAKRELAKALFLRTGRWKKLKFQSSFRSVLFDDTTIRTIISLVQDKRLKYKHVDLLLANVLILEAKIDGRLDNERTRKTFISNLQELGFETSLGDLEHYINQNFSSMSDVRRIAEAVEKFARRIGKDESVLKTIAQSSGEFSDKVRAEELLDTILRNITFVQAEGVVKFGDTGLNKAVSDRLHSAFSGYEAEEIVESLRRFTAISIENAKLQQDIKDLSLRLDKLNENISTAMAIFIGVEQSNKGRPRGYRSCGKVKALCDGFESVENAKRKGRLEEVSGRIDELLGTLAKLKKFHLDVMHSAKAHSATQDTKDFRKIIKRSKKSNSLMEKYEVLNEAVTFLKTRDIDKKAQAIIDLRDHAELYDRIGRLKEKLTKNVREQERLFGKDLNTNIKYTAYSAILQDFLDSGVSDFGEYRPNIDKIKDNIERMGAGVAVNGVKVCTEVAVNMAKGLSKETLSYWAGEIKLSKELKRAKRNAIKEAHPEHLKLLKTERITNIANKGAEQIGDLNPGDEIIFGFGSSALVRIGKMPPLIDRAFNVSVPVDTKVTFRAAVDNSVSVARRDDSYVVTLKGGKSAGTQVDISSLVSLLQLGVGISGGLAKGCSLRFEKLEDCQRFFKSLVTESADVSSWKSASEINMIFENQGGVEVKASAGISKGISDLEDISRKIKDLADSLPKDVDFDLGIEAQIRAKGKVSAKWTEERSASTVKKSRTISYSVEAGVDVGASIELGFKDVSISHALKIAANNFSKLTGKNVPDTRTAIFSIGLKVEKTSEIVTKHRFITADTNIRKSVEIKQNPVQTILTFAQENGLTFRDHNDPRWKGLCGLLFNAEEGDRVTIRWVLKEESLDKIRELQSQGDVKEAKKILALPDSFEPVEISLTTFREIKHTNKLKIGYDLIEMAQSTSAEKVSILSVDLRPASFLLSEAA